MRNSDLLRGAGIAGAVLLAVPVLHMFLGAGAPSAVDAIVGVFAVILLAVWAAAGEASPRRSSRSRSYRRTTAPAAR